MATPVPSPLAAAVLRVARARSAVPLPQATEKKFIAFCNCHLKTERQLDLLCQKNPTEQTLAEYIEGFILPRLKWEDTLFLACATLHLRRFVCCSASPQLAAAWSIPQSDNREIELRISVPWIYPPLRPEETQPVLWRGPANSVVKYLTRALEVMASWTVEISSDRELMRLRALAEEPLLMCAGYTLCEEFGAPGERHIPMHAVHLSSPFAALIVITRYLLGPVEPTESPK